MLAVVEHEQRFPIAQRLEQRIRGRANAVAPHAQRVRHVLRHQLRIGQRRELHPRDTVRILATGSQTARHLEGETGLAAAARAGERQQPSALEQFL